jgi:hypothetical protein
MFAIRSTAPCRPVLLGIWSVAVLVSSDAIMFTRHTLEKRIVNVAVTGEFLGTVPSPLFGSIVLHTKNAISARPVCGIRPSGMSPQLIEPDGLNDPQRRCQGVVRFSGLRARRSEIHRLACALRFRPVIELGESE